MKTTSFYDKVNQLLDNGSLTTADGKLAADIKRYAYSRNWICTVSNQNGAYTLELQ